MAEPDPENLSSGAGQRLGAPETLGISTLDPGHKPPAMPPGRHVTVTVRMLDDTEEVFDVSVSRSTNLASFFIFIFLYFFYGSINTGIRLSITAMFPFSSWLQQTGNRLAWQLKVAWMKGSF